MYKMLHKRFVDYKSNIILFIIFMLSISTCHSSFCPLFKCSPDIVSLNYYSLNTTFDVKCSFFKKVENPSDIVWKFNIGPHQRIITDMDGGVLAPFKHTLINDNISDDNVQTISKLTVHLVNSSYFTNYSLLHLSDMCQQTVRINLQERALGFTSLGTRTSIEIACLLIVFVHLFRLR